MLGGGGDVMGVGWVTAVWEEGWGLVWGMGERSTGGGQDLAKLDQGFCCSTPHLLPPLHRDPTWLSSAATTLPPCHPYRPHTALQPYTFPVLTSSPSLPLPPWHRRHHAQC